ncbi:hypothetical protein [Chromatium okenii]|uniref:hypothetical protein n=1 Tax=Chromatium okenii TaxID=61644 RepID=UPI0026EA15C5|nr:hypothetical protein [Chromatium okenii]MBV5310900.1 hypothetical protein [Chromatium okenii]
MSKTLKPIPNKQVQRMFSHLHGADGELTVGVPYKNNFDDDVYDRSRGILMTSGDIPVADVRFHIFDNWNCLHSKAQTRATQSCIPLTWSEHDGVYAVQHTYVYAQERLNELEQEALAFGYEGLMLRQMNAPYKYGQSTENDGCLLKIKRFQDSEARIIGVVEQEANTNEATTDELGHSKRSSAKSGKVAKDTLGAFLVCDIHSGVTFSVGNGQGLTNELRKQLWTQRDSLIGKIITYTFQEIGTKNAPRLPQFKGFRDVIDLVD